MKPQRLGTKDFGTARSKPDRQSYRCLQVFFVWDWRCISLKLVFVFAWFAWHGIREIQRPLEYRCLGACAERVTQTGVDFGGSWVWNDKPNGRVCILERVTLRNRVQGSLAVSSRAWMVPWIGLVGFGWSRLLLELLATRTGYKNDRQRTSRGTQGDPRRPKLAIQAPPHTIRLIARNDRPVGQIVDDLLAITRGLQLRQANRPYGKGSRASHQR
jgi:hypothetical protein